MELLFALRYGQPQLAAFAEALSCALLPVAAFLLAFAVCSSRQRSLILIALPSCRTASFMHSACSSKQPPYHAYCKMTEFTCNHFPKALK